MKRSKDQHSRSREIRRRLPALCFFLPLLAVGMGSVALAQAFPKTPAEALALEQKYRVTGGDFYRTPEPLPPGKPGELIRSASTNDYTFLKGIHAVRILYHSQSATGKDVAVSAVVVTPPGAPPAGGWPVIAWAHGTSGVAPVCAPSMMQDLYYGNEGLKKMLQAGFAIVATDYAGLGTRGPHEYVNKQAQAHDVINSVRAAHAAVPGLTSKWVVDGHSQGGSAAWGVAEQEVQIKDPNYLGAVLVAPALQPAPFMAYIGNNPQENFYGVYVAYAIKTRFPQFNIADVLSKAGLSHYDAMTTKGCWYYGATLSSSGELNDAINPHWATSWKTNKWVRAFIEETEAMRKPITGPLFVIAGEADQSVPLKSVSYTVSEACKKGYPIEYRGYPGLDHDPVMTNSTPDQIRWIKDRFAGKPMLGNCGTFSEKK